MVVFKDAERWQGKGADFREKSLDLTFVLKLILTVLAKLQQLNFVSSCLYFERSIA